MVNPWEEISLSDYENHMKLDSVMILGIAGGNGLEHIDKNKFQKVYGVDINREYLTTVAERYSDFSDILECIQLNLIEESGRLPKAELLIANLLIEYKGESGYRKFPPRLPEQPIFYPVLNERYAIEIASGWNVKYNDDHKGYVTKFEVDDTYCGQFEVHQVGGEFSDNELSGLSGN